MTTLADLLLGSRSEVVATIEQRLGALSSVVLAPTSLDPRAAPDLTRRVAQSMGSFLDLPVGNLLYGAWDRQRAVERACEETRGRPGASQRVVVGDHVVTCRQSPTVRVDVAGRSFPLLDLVLTVTLHLESVVVQVEEGQVHATGPGDASATARLAVRRPGGGDPLVLLERSTPHVSLPASGSGRRAAVEPPMTAPARAARGDAVGPGWQRDPSGRHQHRYWDGAAWTAHVADDGVEALDPP